jgi:hypothetical protein
MNASLRKVSVILVVAMLALILAIPALADQPQPFTMTFDKCSLPDNMSIDCKFESMGAIVDKGTTTASWVWQTEYLVKGTQTFFGKDGNITTEWLLHYQTHEAGCVYGNFTIVEGTGAYQNLAGNGDYTLCRPGSGDVIYGSLEGEVH